MAGIEGTAASITFMLVFVGTGVAWHPAKIKDITAINRLHKISTKLRFFESTIPIFFILFPLPSDLNQAARSAGIFCQRFNDSASASTTGRIRTPAAESFRVSRIQLDRRAWTPEP